MTVQERLFNRLDLLLEVEGCEPQLALTLAQVKNLEKICQVN